MKVTAATIAVLATTLATAWADDATSSSTTSAAAIPTSSNAATMVSLTANLTSTQRDCFEKNDCDANSDKCLECLGVSQNTVNTAADCMRQCPDPKAGATVSDYANCAAKCYQSLYDEIKTNATDNSLSSSSSAAVKSATDSSKSSSTSDDEDDEENDGSGANAMVISSLLVVAPLALAALMANL